MPQRVVGTTSQILQIQILDTTSTTGGGLTGLVFNSSGLQCYYKRNTANAMVSVSLATMTLGTWASGGFKEVDSTNAPGLYEFGAPNAALVTGADLVTFFFQGATHMVPLPYQVELTATNNQDGTAGGISRIDAAISSRMATFTLPTNFSSFSIDSSGRVTIAPGQIKMKKNAAFNTLLIYMVSSVDLKTPLPSLTVTAKRSIDGGAYASCANAVSEIGGAGLGQGWYYINLANTDTNGDGILFQFTGTGAQPFYIPTYTQP